MKAADESREMTNRPRSRQRVGLSDTDPEAERVLVELARRSPDFKKLAQVFSLNRIGSALVMAEPRDDYPSEIGPQRDSANAARSEMTRSAGDEDQVAAL